MLRYLAACALLLLPAALPAQAVAYLSAGDRALRALEPLAAAGHFERAIAADSSLGEAWWKAANALLEAAEFERDRRLQREFFQRAERLAREGVRLLPGSADARFVLGRAVGRAALEAGPRERLRAAAEIRREAEAALQLDPSHDGAMHLLGRWHAEVMRLGAATRFMARRLLGGGDAIRGANWGDAERLLKQAVAIAPERLTHRIALAEIYIDRRRFAAAREQLQALAALPATAFNDDEYKRAGAELRTRLR